MWCWMPPGATDRSCTAAAGGGSVVRSICCAKHHLYGASFVSCGCSAVFYQSPQVGGCWGSGGREETRKEVQDQVLRVPRSRKVGAGQGAAMAAEAGMPADTFAQNHALSPAGHHFSATLRPGRRVQCSACDALQRRQCNSSRRGCDRRCFGQRGAGATAGGASTGGAGAGGGGLLGGYGGFGGFGGATVMRRPAACL
jgi:hypothetical protein